MKEMAVFQLALVRVNYANMCTLRTVMLSLTVFRGGLFPIERQEDQARQVSALC